MLGGNSWRPYDIIGDIDIGHIKAKHWLLDRLLKQFAILKNSCSDVEAIENVRLTYIQDFYANKVFTFFFLITHSTYLINAIYGGTYSHEGIHWLDWFITMPAKTTNPTLINCQWHQKSHFRYVLVTLDCNCPPQLSEINLKSISWKGFSELRNLMV